MAAGLVGASGRPRAHVIGAGLAGLSATVALASNGFEVQLIEASTQAGGRCRSYHDPVLDMTIDNGNHLVLSGNHAAFAFLRQIGAEDRLVGPDQARFPFFDVRDGRRWTVAPNAGPVPWWILSPARRVPGARLIEYLAPAALLAPRSDRRIDEVLGCAGPLWDRLLEPLLLAALNTQPQQGSARLAGRVIGETLARGGRACRPRIAAPSLSATFIDPALALLEARGACVRLGQRVRGLKIGAGVVTGLGIGDAVEPIGASEPVILATPPWIAKDLLPDLTVPDAFSPIVNGHFKVAPPAGAEAMVGLIGAAAQWVFAFPDRVSVTVSAAEALIDTDRETLARRLWADVRAVHGLAADMPAWQIVKERRATFAATPAQNARRPAARTPLANLVLAGDWTDTGLPATIEGAVRSGGTAASLALKSHRAAR